MVSFTGPDPSPEFFIAPFWFPNAILRVCSRRSAATSATPSREVYSTTGPRWWFGGTIHLIDPPLYQSSGRIIPEFPANEQRRIQHIQRTWNMRCSEPRTGFISLNLPFWRVYILHHLLLVMLGMVSYWVCHIIIIIIILNFDIIIWYIYICEFPSGFHNRLWNVFAPQVWSHLGEAALGDHGSLHGYILAPCYTYLSSWGLLDWGI